MKRTVIFAIVAIIVVAVASSIGTWYVTHPPSAEEEVYYLGLAQHDHTNAWEALFAYGFFWYCEDHGYKGVMMDARHSIELQAEQIHRLVDMGVDAMICCPCDERALNSEFDYCKENNVPVMTSPYLADHDWPLMWVATSFVEQGQGAAEYMLEFLENKYGEPKGVVLNLRGLTGETAAEQRHNGFIEVMNEYPEIEVLTHDTRWMTEVAKDIVEKVVPTRPDIDGVYCANLAIVDGFLAGMEALGVDPEPYYVVGLDAGPNVLQAIREDKVDICIAQPPQWYCPIMAEYLISYLEKGEEALPDFGDVVTAEDLVITGEPHLGVDFWSNPQWAPATITDIYDELGKENHQRHFKIANIIVTEENVDDPALWGNLELPGW